MAPALAGSLEQASGVLQQGTKEEADVDVILERIDVAKRRVGNAGGRTSVVHQFAHVTATSPHAREPGIYEWPQLTLLCAQPGVDRGVPFHRRGKAKDVVQAPQRRFSANATMPLAGVASVPGAAPPPWLAIMATY